MHRLVCTYETGGTVTLGTLALPGASLVEDDDGIRVLVVGSGRIWPDHWQRAYLDGATGVLLPGPEGSRWIPAEHFAELRTAHADGFWHLPDQGAWAWVPSVPTWGHLVHALPELGIKAARGFVATHVHSEFSALDGLSKISEMVVAATADGQPALAVTDHGSCAAHPQLQVECDKAGIHAILGIEANMVADRRDRDPSRLYDYWHLILWAETDRGLKNLWGASTEANATGFYGRPRMDWDILSRHATGVMASTGCLRGPLAKLLLDEQEERATIALGRLMDIYGDRLYVEIQTNGLPEQRTLNERLVVMARRHGLPLIAATDSHYPTREDRDTHKVWLSAQTKKELTDDQDLFKGQADYHMLTEAEARASLSYLPQDVVDEAIASTLAVAERAKARISGKAAPPVYLKGATPAQDLARLDEICRAAWAAKIGHKPGQDAYEARYQREMGLLGRKQFGGYFLLVADYCLWAREHGILIGPGRGSGCGCLVAYLAGITGIDPIDAGLLFERFLTEGRTSLPDFDVDFPASRRAELIAYIQRRWGAERVVRVGSHLRLKNKGVVRDLARVLKSTIDIHYPDIEAISEIIRQAELGSAGLGMPWDDLWAQVGDKLEPYRAKYPLLFDYADRIQGRLKSYGQHAAGVVISTDGSLHDVLPMRRGEEGEPMVTEFDFQVMDEFGLVKCDFLVLRTLDTIQACVDLVSQRYGEAIDVSTWTYEYDDPCVWAEIDAGNTLGQFQVETYAGTQMCRQLCPTNLSELADVITLVRPGPMDSGLTAAYLRRRNGQEPVNFPDPRLKEALSPTYGVLIYQEQVLAACTELAGYSEAEADEIRKILGKKKIEAVAKAGEEFVRRATERGMDAQAAAGLWEQIAEFARYAFNKSHAYAYAMLAYWTAWLRCHWPGPFFAAVLSTVKTDRVPEFVTSARKLGYEVLPPDINLSGDTWTLDRDRPALRYGLGAVKGIGDAVVEAVQAGQPFVSWDDFLARKTAKVNMGAVAILARVGALDTLVPNRAALETYLRMLKEGATTQCVHKDLQAQGPNGLPCTFDWASESPPLGKKGQPLKAKPPPKRCTIACRHYTPPAPVNLEDLDAAALSAAEVREREQDLLGLYLSSTPFDRIPPEDLAACLSAEAAAEAVEGEYVVAAIVRKMRPHTDRLGQAMCFLTFFAQDGEVEAVCFANEWAAYQADIRAGELCYTILRKTDRGFQLVAYHPLP